LHENMLFLQAREEVVAILIAFGYGADTKEVLAGFKTRRTWYSFA